jgi:RimJ/RimL family protein N-acetyltransferase
MLKTRWVKLIPFDERNHFEDYLTLRNDTRLLHLWSRRRSLVTRHQLEDELRNDLSGHRHLFMSIASLHTGKIVGFVYDYQYHSDWALSWVTTVIAWDYIERGYGVHAQALFMPFLFEQFNLRKIYCNVYSHNLMSTKILTKVGFQEEARLKEHVPFKQGYADLITYALHRSDLSYLLKVREQLCRKS